MESVECDAINSELWRLLDCHFAGSLDSVKADRLVQLLASNEKARRLYLEMTTLNAALYWETDSHEGIRLSDDRESRELIQLLLVTDNVTQPVALEAGEDLSKRLQHDEDLAHRVESPYKIVRYFGWPPRLRRLAFSEYGLAASIAIACLMSYLAGRESHHPEILNSIVEVVPSPHATMLSSTGCVWGAGEAGRPAYGQTFASGDTLQLLEGIAEFSIGEKSDVRLQMEGPTSMVLASDLGVSLSYGKVILNSSPHDGRPLPIDTAFGRVLVDYGTEVGLITFGSKAEIHCFQGRVTVESPWLQVDERGLAMESLAAGESIAFDHVGQAGLQVDRDAADRLRFTPQVAMNNDFLSVTPEYVAEVLSLHPVAYWRFEQTEGGVVKNEMGPAYAGQIRGTANWSGPEGNHALELGLAEDTGSMLVDDSWDEALADDYSVELWMKPSHHHLGSLVGFVGPFNPELRQNTHGIALEIGGPVNPGSQSRVNRVRFLHRSPLSAETTNDSNCFSQKAYAARRWQHVVGVKEGTTLRLFIDGVLVDTAENVDLIPNGLQLVIGQLYTDSLDRIFVGQIDEIAIYNRSLSPREVARHHKLLRPPIKPPRDVL